jgi:hypothetical protein
MLHALQLLGAPFFVLGYKVLGPLVIGATFALIDLRHPRDDVPIIRTPRPRFEEYESTLPLPCLRRMNHSQVQTQNQ